jgi:two-component system sensor histidine kinase KdpD
MTIGVVTLSSLVCGFLSQFSHADIYANLIFVLAVLIISRLTDGYVYGIFTSIIAVFIVNNIFTYPYFAFNFTIEGYPLTFAIMLIVSIITSTLTTQIKQHENARVETEKELLRTNLLKAISHDIRTPLTAIIGSTDAMLENESLLTDEQKRTLLRDARDEAKWLIRMTENILSVTSVDGEVRLNKKHEVLEEIVGEAVQTFKKHYPDMPVSVSIPSDVIFFSVDATLLKQVLMNIMENAVIHGVTTTHIALTAKKSDDSIQFSIENDGAPISSQILPQIFKRGYYMAEGDGEAFSRRNMGIGLHVCASIIRAHGGNITAKNTDEGVTFSFSLPLPKEGAEYEQ